jgi:hypothetical protein
LAAERNQSGEAIGVHAVDGQPTAIEGHQARQITAGRVTGEKDLVRVAAVSGDILESPCDCRRGILNVGRSLA